ncbi:MAG: hypothetical protein HKN91_10290 [Acidimicrobiia bacterium]|nr:hypothetical protein [Acidimicrobiia bacterium]
MKWRRGFLGLLIVLVGSVACSDGRQTARGIVIEVEGGITEVEGFLLRLPDGQTIRLSPADGVLFHDNAPIGHIRDHLRTGETVEVEFEVLDDGSAVAYEIRD